jgi:hypothetical protein
MIMRRYLDRLQQKSLITDSGIRPEERASLEERGL